MFSQLGPVPAKSLSSPSEKPSRPSGQAASCRPILRPQLTFQILMVEICLYLIELIYSLALGYFDSVAADLREVLHLEKIRIVLFH